MEIIRATKTAHQAGAYYVRIQAMLGRVVVLPECRNKGIGTFVVKEAEKWAKELDFHTAVVESREYIQANKDWLEAKAKEEGVKALPNGICYKVLAEGNAQSAKPSVRSIVTAHYTGKTIDGKTFDSSRGGVPLACRLCDLIEGWIIAMQQMHIGDKWEVYIPAEMGYGKFSQPGIPGGSTLIFEIELLGIA